MRVIIVDDEPLARERIRDLLARHAGVEIVAECGDGVAALGALDELRPAAAFLDVQMPGLDGFDVLAATGHVPAVVFITAYDEHALRAFDAHAVDYLLKPIDARRFDVALARLAERLAGPLVDPAALRALSSQLSLARGGASRLAVRGDGRIAMVAVADIDWIEAAGNYVCLHVADAQHIMRETLKSLEARLDPAVFVRIHRSAIVNVERIAELAPAEHGEYRVTLRGGARLHATRSFSRQLRERLG